MSNTEHARAVCQRVYSETSAFYQEHHRKLSEDVKYTILYGPPLVRAPLLILGEQPGGRGGREPTTWDNDPPFVAASWPYASVARKIWDIEVLRESVGLNMNFFHARDRAEWAKIAGEHRGTFENFCRPRAIEIVKALNPQIVLAVGSTAFEAITGKKLRDTKALLKGNNDRTLVAAGPVVDDSDVCVYGVVHLSNRFQRPDDGEAERMHCFFAKLITPIPETNQSVAQ